MILLRKRYVIAFVAFFGHLSLYWLRYNIKLYKDLSPSLTDNELFLTETTYFIGSACACFGGILVTRYGGASLFGIAISASAKIYLSIHVLYKLGLVPLLISTFIRGFFNAVALCAVADLWSRWSAPEERFKLVALSYLGNKVIYLFYFICECEKNIDYEWSFYVTGGIPLIWAFIWTFLFKVKNDPDDDKSVSDFEKQYLAEKINIVDKDRSNVISYPWKSIFTSKPFWILCLASFIFSIGEKFSDIIPSNITDKGKFVRSFSTEQIRFITLGEISLILIVVYIAHWITKKRKCTLVQTRNFYISSAFVIGAVSLTAYFYYWQHFTQLFFTILQGTVHTCSKISFLVKAIDISPEYSGILCGIQTTIMAIGAFLTPTLILCTTNRYISVNIYMLTHFNDMVREWDIICFEGVSVLYVLVAFLYIFCGSAELQPRNEIQRQQFELSEVV